MTYKYGEYTQEQIVNAKARMRKKIYFLLLLVDKKTASEYEGIDVYEAFENVLYLLGGLNELLFCPNELVTVMSLIKAAQQEYLSDSFCYKNYRKLILDAGNEVLKISEVDYAES